MSIPIGITKSGEVKDHALIKGKAYYDSKTATLTLDNVEITDFILFEGSLTIILIGENTVLGIRDKNFPFLGNGGGKGALLTIEGEGSLCVNGIIRVLKLLVKDCTLHMKHYTNITEVYDLKAEKANIIIEYLVTFMNDNMHLKGCGIVHKTPIDFNIDGAFGGIMIIQKDKQKYGNKP